MYRFNTKYNNTMNDIFKENQYFYDYARNCGFLNGYNLAVYQKSYQLGYNYAKNYHNEAYEIPMFFQEKNVQPPAGTVFNNNSEQSEQTEQTEQTKQTEQTEQPEQPEQQTEQQVFEDEIQNEEEDEKINSSYSDDFIEESISLSSEEDFKFSPLNKTIKKKNNIKKSILFNLDSSYSSYDSDIEPPLPPPPSKPITIQNEKIVPLRSLPKLPSSNKRFLWENSSSDEF